LATILHAAAAQAGQVQSSCDTAIGVWETVPPDTPGRAVVAKAGGVFHVVFVKPALDTRVANVPSLSLASRCSCEGPGDKLQWKCVTDLSLRAADVGTQAVYGGLIEGDNWQSWVIGADGKAGEPARFKRVKQAGRDAATDRQQLAKLLREHVDAVDASNVEAILAGMTDGVVYLAPGQPPVLGRDALRKVMEPFYGSNDAQVSMRAEETVVADDWAWEWGHLSGSIRPKSVTQATAFEGKYLYIYQRQRDGSWKIARDIYNESGSSGALRLR
jgi:uncharacterized protein (TIGR02246 family)